VARPSAFKSEQARAAYCRLYDEAIGLSEVPVEESDVETAFGTTHLLSGGCVAATPHRTARHGDLLDNVASAAAGTGGYQVRMLDSVGDVSKSVATGVLSSPARVVDWIDEALDRLGVGRAAFVAASTGAWMATHYAMARPDRVERLAFVCPAGIVSLQHTRRLIRTFMDGRFRATRPRLEAFVDSLAMEKSRQRMRTDPWRPIVEQLITGPLTFRRGLREPRPVRCDIKRLADTSIPVLAIVGRDETLHDGAIMAERFRQRLPGAGEIGRRCQPPGFHRPAGPGGRGAACVPLAVSPDRTLK
jgi:pimeloyl-ACP methyl ester carboxylesterase